MTIDSEKAHHLFDIADDFRNAFLISKRADGEMHARPLAVAKIEEESSSAYFATSIESPKVAEIESEPQVLVTFQAGSKFAAINGTAEVIREQALIDALWSESWRPWFPEGRSDSSLCILRVDVESGEYWDASGLKGLKVVLASANARLHHRQANPDLRDQAKVELK